MATSDLFNRKYEVTTRDTIIRRALANRPLTSPNAPAFGTTAWVLTRNNPQSTTTTTTPVPTVFNFTTLWTFDTPQAGSTLSMLTVQTTDGVFAVDWGDGSKDTDISSGTQLSHTFS